MSNIEELRVELVRLRAQRDELDKRIYDIDQKLCAADAIAKIGEVVCWKRGKQDARGRVIGLERWTSDTVTLVVVLLKKDGTEGAICKVRPYDKPRLALS